MRRLVNLLVLFISLLLFYHSFFHIKQAFTKFNDLQQYTGTLSRIDSTIIPRDTSTAKVMLLQLLEHSTEFRASRYFGRLREGLHYGDSLLICTKTLNSSFGNVIAERSTTWPVTDENEIFHLVRLNDGEVLIDFEENRRSVKWGAIVLPALGLVMFGLFLYTWRGKNVDWEIG